MNASGDISRRPDGPADERDEVLGERLRLALDGSAERGEPDFAAIYRRAESRGAASPAASLARKARRALFALPAAAALAVIVGLGGRGISGADDRAAIRAELRLLAGELAGAGEPGTAPDDLFSSELAIFIDDLWNQLPGEID